MRSLIIVLIVLVLALAGGMGYLFYSNESKDYAYVLNQKVFEGFKGTKEFEAKLSKTETRQRYVLDSVAAIIKAAEDAGGKANSEFLEGQKKMYNQLYQQFSSHNQQDLQSYNDEVWKQINQYLVEYGKKNGYDFIYGANGTGTLMYADSTLDITNEVVKYINEKYEGE